MVSEIVSWLADWAMHNQNSQREWIVADYDGDLVKPTG